MYDTSTPLKRIKDALAGSGLDDNGDLYETIARAEMGLYLMERLGCAHESPAGFWAVLGGLPVPLTRTFSAEQRHLLANGRLFLHVGGPVDWEWTLKQYANVPEGYRCYKLLPDDLKNQIVERTGNNLSRLDRYRDVLGGQLTHRLRDIKIARADKVTFDIQMAAERRQVTVEIPEALVAKAEAVELPWFTAPRLRKKIRVEQGLLLQTAKEMDKREKERRLPLRGWASFVEDVLHYQLFSGGKLSGDTPPFVIEKTAHLPGMVSAGKSTAMKLLAAQGVLFDQFRVTIVVGDSATAMNMAQELNLILGEEGKPPVAVALLGRSQRDRHLQMVYRSSSVARDNHLALRWLNTACPIQGLAGASLPAPLKPGEEPCTALRQTGLRGGKPMFVACPLFNLCPAQQLYRDMPNALIWIVTPGAMGEARIPPQAEPRNIRLAELIYEHSDLVVFDEVDMVQVWFDNVYAPQLMLMDTQGRGMLDMLDTRTAEGWSQHRYQADRHNRWLQAQRNSVFCGSLLMTRLSKSTALAKWVEDNYFTAFKLFADLSWHCARASDRSRGKRHPRRKWQDAQGKRHYGPERDSYIEDELSKRAWGIFRLFLSGGDLTGHWSLADDLAGQSRYQLADTEHDNEASMTPTEAEALTALSQILVRFLAQGGIVGSRTMLDYCRKWLLRYVYHQTEDATELDDEELDFVAAELEFCIGVAGLDYNLLILLLEWYNRPPDVVGVGDGEDRYERAPVDWIHILPTPPLGASFGFYYHKDPRASIDAPPGEMGEGEVRRLSTFEYRNIGRWLTMHFHDLRLDLDGMPGPAVLALSGTSWLPDSARWHYDVPPIGVLLAKETDQGAIATSQFHFAPQRGRDGKPIRVSGSNDLVKSAADLAARLAEVDEETPGSLRCEIGELERLARDPASGWEGRARILIMVNSYRQAEAVAHQLASTLRVEGRALRVYCVKRPDQGEAEPQWGEWRHGHITTGDVSMFANTDGQILVAPIQAVGRGYNILTEIPQTKKKVAALGSIYFLTRPMPVPFDSQDSARAMNRQVLNLCQDDAFFRGKSLYEQANALRWRTRAMHEKLDRPGGYTRFDEEQRAELAASTAGVLIQTCGRLLRGGVPFRAWFVDAEWAPQSAKDFPDPEGERDSAKTSLLVAVVEKIQQYATQDEIGQALYWPLAVAMSRVEHLRMPESYKPLDPNVRELSVP